MFDTGVYAVLNRLQSAILCYANAVLMPIYAMLCHVMPWYAILHDALLGCMLFVFDVPVVIVAGGGVLSVVCV